MQHIIRFTKGKIRRERVPSAEEVEEKRTNAFLDTLRETLEKGEYPKQDELIDRLLDQGHAATDIASALIHLLNGGSPRAGERASEPIPEPPPEPRPYPKYEPRTPARSRAPQDEPRGPARSRPPQFSDRQDAPPRPNERPPRDPAKVGTVSHEPGMVRLSLNVGAEHKIAPGDVLGVILGTTRLTREVIGAIHLMPQETLVDVSEDHANLVLKKLNGIRFKGRKLAAKTAA